MKVLPATQTMGTLSHRTLVLELPTFTHVDVEDALAGRRECEPARILAHEMAHWFDIVGSVWGQDYLDGLFLAYDAVLARSASAIDAFPAALKQFDAERAILFPSYFKFVKAEAMPQAGPGTWQMLPTTGVRFKTDGTPDEDDPILFVRFFDGGGEIARQPISAGTLLEMRALGAEVSAYGELRGLRPAGEGLVEELLYQRESVKLFYDPELTTYSAAAHLLSHAFAGVADATMVMALGPLLADLALNVPPTLIQRLIPPQTLAAAGPRRVRGFRRHADRGFLFACLCFHFHGLDAALREGHDTFDALLINAGLPVVEALYDAAHLYVTRRRPSQFAHPDLRRIRASLQAAGLKILARRRRLEPIRTAEWADFPSPRIMDFEAETFQVGQQVLSEADADFLNECSNQLDVVTRAALRAVRGFEFGFTDFVY